MKKKSRFYLKLLSRLVIIAISIFLIYFGYEGYTAINRIENIENPLYGICILSNVSFTKYTHNLGYLRINASHGELEPVEIILRFEISANFPIKLVFIVPKKAIDSTLYILNKEQIKLKWDSRYDDEARVTIFYIDIPQEAYSDGQCSLVLNCTLKDILAKEAYSRRSLTIVFELTPEVAEKFVSELIGYEVEAINWNLAVTNSSMIDIYLPSNIILQETIPLPYGFQMVKNSYALRWKAVYVAPGMLRIAYDSIYLIHDYNLKVTTAVLMMSIGGGGFFNTCVQIIDIILEYKKLFNV